MWTLTLGRARTNAFQPPVRLAHAKGSFVCLFVRPFAVLGKGTIALTHGRVHAQHPILCVRSYNSFARSCVRDKAQACSARQAELPFASKPKLEVKRKRPTYALARCGLEAHRAPRCPLEPEALQDYHQPLQV